MPDNPGLEAGLYIALIYDYVEDMAERRQPHREAHLGRIAQAKRSGELVNAGALGDGPDGAVIVFAPGCDSAAEQFAENDPYVVAGLVPRWRVTPWNVVA
jgi:uncharacterized protein YciI